MIGRRFALACAVGVAATSVLPACSTFDRNDAAAAVGDTELSQDDLATLLEDSIIQGGITGPVAEDGTVAASTAGEVISLWAVTEALDAASLVDVEGSGAEAAAAERFPEEWPDAPAEVKQLVVRLFAAQAVSFDDPTVRATLDDADIHVDSRYGRWDAATLTVLPFA